MQLHLCSSFAIMFKIGLLLPRDFSREVSGMKKKLHRLLNPSAWLYFVVLALFCVAAALLEHYLLFWIMLGFSAGLLVCYILFRVSRHRQLRDFVQENMDLISGSQGSESPFPLVTVKLSDGQVVYANDAFAKLTGLRFSFTEHTITDLLSDFSMDWLLSGKTESPYDVSIGQHRYRVYGSVIRAFGISAILYFRWL